MDAVEVPSWDLDEGTPLMHDLQRKDSGHFGSPDAMRPFVPCRVSEPVEGESADAGPHLRKMLP
eukprot:6582789-Pyramimonas_sp.AAC.1